MEPDDLRQHVVADLRGFADFDNPAKEDGQRGSDKEIETPPIEKVAQCFVHHTNNQHVL
jgi:hypothetical protein